MAVKMQILLVLALAACAQAATEGSTLTSRAQAMKHVFYRSEHEHESSMKSITEGLTSMSSALELLEAKKMTTPALIEVTRSLHGSHLRKKVDPGYGGLGKAKGLLNEMIFESKSKYDSEIAKCTEYYASQCADMEECRGKIAGANYLAANSRSMILGAQSTVNKCEADIPNTKFSLRKHKADCKLRKNRMDARLKVLKDDIEVLSTILKMTDCKGSFIQQQQVMHCEDPCTQKSFITFSQNELSKQVSQLQSTVSHGLLQDGFKDLFSGIEGLKEMSFLQLEAHQFPNNGSTVAPRTHVPASPCTDPSGGGVSSHHKRAAKCTIAASPQCYKLQERFLLIQSGVEDDRDNLVDEIDATETKCEDTSDTLQTQIRNDQQMLDEAQHDMADAMKKEAQSAESARQTAKEHEELNEDLTKEMKSCSDNYINYETEICALKKIRGELYKMKGASQAKMFFQDCEVGKWAAEECSRNCNGGEQKLSRAVMTHPYGGSKCLPLAAVKKCNMQPCPVDCRLNPWEGWSKCSAECGGGIRQRLREVVTAAKHGGQECGQTSEARPCNNQACEKECELSSWTKWSACSKDCDGGTQKRQKWVKTAATGAGKCADKWAKERLQYKKCNTYGCLSAAAANARCSTWEKDTVMYTCENVPTCCSGYEGMGLTKATVQCVPSAWKTDTSYKVKCGAKAMKCQEKLDIVFLIDGSGSLGKKGWAAEMVAASTFIDAFSGTGANTQMSTILYSGPRNWRGVWKCWRRNKKSVDMDKDCKIKTVSHLGEKMDKVKAGVKAMTWPQGSTLTSLALGAAKSELQLGRKDAKSIVVVITDGRPMSWRRTYWAARSLRKVARLVWVPVTKYAPLRSIKRWATRRWQENVVPVPTFKDLENPELVSSVVANICHGLK